jgi:phosphoribosylformylglycinamidine cyclo-ligase
MYLRGEYDLAGTIIGCVERDAIVDGSRIQPGDAIIGLSSTGLHTNGYSLALKALLERAKLDLNRIPEGCSRTLAEELMAVHRSYGSLVLELIESFDIRGIAHITGGGFEGIIPRALPEGVRAEIAPHSWEVPPIFRLIQKAGNVAREEMYRVFNMGIGLVLICPEAEVSGVLTRCRDKGEKARKIGACASSSGEPGLTLQF